MKITGVLPALITPVKSDGSINETAARRLIRRLSECGADGFYILGSTGEGILMEEKRRMEMCEIAVDETAGKMPVICHTAAMNFDSALRLTKHAAAAGADAVSAIPPIFFHYDRKELLLYYKRLAEATDLPFIMYNHTAANGGMSAEAVAEIFNGVANVTGVKWTVNNYCELMKLKRLTDGKINIINGPDEMLVEGLAAGADAGIGTTYNVMLPEYKKIYESFKSGDIKRAADIQRRINTVTEIIVRYGTIPATKYMCSLMGIEAGCAMQPLKRFTPEEGSRFETELKAAGWQPDGSVTAL